MLIDFGKNSTEIRIELLDISTLLNNSMTTEYSADSALVLEALESKIISNWLKYRPYCKTCVMENSYFLYNACKISYIYKWVL